LVIRWRRISGNIFRSLAAILVKVATCSPPEAIRTASGFHRLKAFTGPPDHDRHERQ